MELFVGDAKTSFSVMNSDDLMLIICYKDCFIPIDGY